MQKFINIITKAALAVSVTLLATSCIMDKEEMPDSLHRVIVQMSVSVEGMTKAEAEASTSAEKVINTLRVYAFYGERLAGYALRGATALNEPFYMDLELPQEGGYDVDFYLIANEAAMAYEEGTVSLSETMTKTQLESIKYTGLKGSTLPMYCKDTKTVEEDGGPISFTLGRSLAKLSVYAAAAQGSDAEPQILAVNLLAGGTRLYSYLFEQADAELNAVESRLNDRNFLTSTIGITKKVEKGSAQAENPSNYTAVIEGVYLPEVTYGVSDPTNWGVSSGNDRAAVLFVEYVLAEGEAIRHSYVYLPPIERNNHYKVCILINSEGGITINYHVADWETAEVVNRVIDYPTHSYLRESIPTTEEEGTAKPTQPATMSASQPFAGYFQMLYPDGDSWMPVLKGDNKDKCTVAVYDSMTNQPISGYVPSSDTNWYRIEVTPTGSMQVGDEVRLEIAYSATGAEIIDYLMINGSFNEYYWPYEGGSAQDDNYVIITMVN